MGRPRNDMQCIGIDVEGNKNMKSAWELKPSHGTQVFIVLANATECVEWKFSHFTLAGARLFKKVNGNWYSRLISWDKGDRLFITKADAVGVVVWNAIQAKSKHDLASRKYQQIIENILKEEKLSGN